jgi:general secretion pathway protein C
MKKLSDFLNQVKRKNETAALSQNMETRASQVGFNTSRMESFLMQANLWFQVHGYPILGKIDLNMIRTSAFVLVGSFLLANVASTAAANASFKLFHTSRGSAGTRGTGDTADMAGMILGSSRSSTSSVKDQILLRNLFNSEGKLPPEDLASAGQKSNDINFEKVPCVKESLPVEVLGTIFTGNPFKGIAIIKDSKVADADIYQVGQTIIDYEDYELYKVEQGYVEFRKADTKICLDVAGRRTEEMSSAATSSTPKVEVSETIDIGDEEMKNLLGPELARAMNEAKLIPDPTPGGEGIQGFKLLAIVPGSIFDRVKLQNEDIILEVNGQSLKDPTQGYRFFEALQQQREITINFTRKGEPMVRKVRVK